MNVTEERSDEADLRRGRGLESSRKLTAVPTRDTVTFLPEPEAEEVLCPVISVDDHAMEPFDLFESRLPRRLLDQAPRVVYDVDGIPFWMIAGTAYPLITADGAVGRPQSEWNNCAQKLADFRDGVWDPRARLADMDLCGIWASLCFPSIAWGFAGTRLNQLPDPELGYTCIRAYNDWMIEQWCATDRDRYIPCQLAWFGDPVLAAQEIYRNAEKGCRAVSFSENPELLGYPSIHQAVHWDPFLRACEETNTVINLHVGSSGRVTCPTTDSPQDVVVALFPLSGMAATVDWIYSRVPLRFPNVKIVLSEAGASWVPMIVERLRRAWKQVDAADASWNRSDPNPVDVLYRNFWFASIEDPAAYRHDDLVNKIMIECDYPHRDSSWPGTQALLREMFGEQTSTETIRQICYRNAAALFGHPEPPEQMLFNSSVGGAGASTLP
jgi:predicted TIM-barrel fold metal-dependent hydrolase